MSANTENELLDLAVELREYTNYFAELGAETVEVSQVNLSPPPESAAAVISPGEVKPAPKEIIQPQSMPVRASASRRQEALFGDLTPPPQAQPLLAPSTETLEDIWNDIGDCTRCGLCEGRTQVVNTNGNRQARLMFVGEAPGADEDAQGKPFVGRAGQLLTKIIEAIGLKREEVIIGNVNRCRPPGNRQPTLEEAAICRPFLFREIAAVKPEVIVVLGNTALRNLLETREGITRVRGRFQDFRGIKVMPTFHPAYLLRDPSKKRETWEDLKKVRDYLDGLSSEQS
jgi:DNA polymerase